MKSLIFLLTLGAFTPAPAPRAPFPAEGAIRSTAPSSYSQYVLVEMGFGRCSGTVVKKDIVLTAAHCVDDMPEGAPVKVTFTGSQKRETRAFIPVWVGTRLSGEDIALLQGDTGDVQPLAVAITPPVFPFPTYYVSNRTRQEVVPAAVLEPLFEDKGVIIVLFADTWPGDSGSALLNQRGEVIGVVFAYSPKHPHSGYATSFEPILKALREIDQ